MPEPLNVRTILIGGPTASGKSRLALALAERLNGVIINADSMQVYRELRILTARPTPYEEARAPHELYGFVSGREAYSAGRWGVDAALAIAAAGESGHVPILVGGTGLYFKVLLEGLAPIPAVAPEVRSYWRAQAAGDPVPLHALLRARDPEMAARLMPTDRQRIVRALEVLDGTGRSLAAWQRESARPVVVAAAARRILVLPDRAQHTTVIDRRFEAMMAAGALEEVRLLLAHGFSGELPVMRALGVGRLAAHLTGKASLREAVAAAKAETRRYAKRQATWLRRNMISWKTMNAQQMESMTADDLAFMCR